MTPGVTTRRFTTAEYHRMGEVGILHEDDRVELIEGEIVQMAAMGEKHASRIARLNHLFFDTLGRAAVVWVQCPIPLSEHTEPEPDFALLRPRQDFYASGLPGPGDVLLLVEVSDSSLAYDRDTKVPLYARAGIPEVWLVDLERSVVLVYRDPTPRGYQTIRAARPGEWLAPLAFPGRELAVADVVGETGG
jgi:Uma2 family endonuclease